jgi:hypothetical protein
LGFGVSLPVVDELGVVELVEVELVELRPLVVLVLEPEVVSEVVAELFVPAPPALEAPSPIVSQAARRPPTASAKATFGSVTRTMSSLLR